MAVLKRKNWKNLRKQDLPRTAFIVLMIISLGLVILPAWNYTRYYIALNGFDYTLAGVNIYTSNVSMPTKGLAKINLTIFTTNPTDYSGFVIGTVGATLQYIGNTHLVWVGPGYGRGSGKYVSTNLWPLTSATTLHSKGPIGPNSNKTILLKILIKPDYNNPSGPDEDAINFIDYLATSPSKIEWLISCTLPLGTFLGTFSFSKTFDRITLSNQSAT